MMPVRVHVPATRFFEVADRVRALGLHPELALSAAWLETAPGGELERIAAAGLDRRFEFTLHAPFLNLDAGADDPEALRVTRRRYRQAVEIAARLKAVSIVFHSGYDPFTVEKFEPGWLDRAAETWDGLLALAPDWMTFCLENIRDRSPEPLAFILDRIGSPRVKACWDFGHCNLFSRVPFAEWADRLGPRLGELHLHDNRGREDDHLALGEGTFPAGEILDRLAAAGRRPILTLEAHDEERVAAALDFLAPWRERFGGADRG